MLRKPADKVVFADDILENFFVSLNKDNIIKKSIERIILKLKDNIFIGDNIPKKQIPKSYIKKYEIDNLWKINLPDGWRLVYSVMPLDSNFLLATILDFFDHKNYERIFNY